MPITEQERMEEEAYLTQVFALIKAKIKKSNQLVSDSKKDVERANQEMWDDMRSDVGSLSKLVTATQYLSDVAQQTSKMTFYDEEAKRLRLLENTPYFARIDFTPDGGEKMKIYIGIANLKDDDTWETYVFDWRAPVSGMYYDYELGPASYECPAGTIAGEVDLKRHYQIYNGKLLGMFDSGLNIEDDVLQEVLSKNASEKMQNIVTTIQREQNKIIRDSESKILIAYGPAGSGKTSVAMQRIAFLLYRFREKLKNENIMIFSPNNVFADYISDVLPQLGEQNIRSVTLSDYADMVLSEEFIYGDNCDMMECILLNEDRDRMESIAYKNSDAFLQKMKTEVEKIKREGIPLSDVEFCGQLIISGEEMRRLYADEYVYLPAKERFAKLRNRVAALMRPYEKKRIAELAEQYENSDEMLSKEEITARARMEAMQEFNHALDTLRMQTSLNIYSYYLALLKENKKAYAVTKKCYENKHFFFEDIAPLLYLYGMFQDVKNTLKYVLIDEAQDYTPLTYEALGLHFKRARMTILGDENQAINPVMNVGSFSNIQAVFPEATVMELSKSYRSTKQINAFCNRFLGIENANYMERDGDEPQIIACEDVCLAMAEDIKRLKQTYNRITIVSKTAREAESLYLTLQEKIEIKLVRNKAHEYENGVLIMPSYMAKGLEFDVVLVPFDSYGEENSRLLYTVCSRAMHVLRLYQKK